MKKFFINNSVLLFSILIAQTTFAQLPTGEISKLSADYHSPKGDGSAQYINLTDFGEYNLPKLEVENYNGLLIFNIEDKSFELDLTLLGVKDAEKIKVKDLNFRNIASSVSLNLANLNLDDPSTKLNVRSPSLECQRHVSDPDIKTDLLMNCLKNSSFRISDLDYEAESFQIKNLVSENAVESNKVDFSGLKLDINNGKFKGETKSSISSGLTIKVEGLTSYKIESNTVEIRLDKAKAGFFNIRGKLFDELKKMESETVIVNEPYITIELKD